MKNHFYIILAFIFSVSAIRGQDTFSICVVDTITGEVGSAGASCIGAPQIPQGCYILSDVLPGVGVIHTQAYYLSANQNYAHQLMEMGLTPQQIVDSLVANDAQNNPGYRQYGVVDLYNNTARSAAYTGANCDDYKNHITGPNYSIQGNILLGQQILDSMETRYLNSEGELACRLMAAMQGAKVIGADTRCLDDGVSSLSAFLRVAQPGDPSNNIYLDLNVPSTPDGVDPIDSLQSLINEWGACNITNLNDLNSTESIVVHPNPTQQSIFIEFKEEVPKFQKVTLYNSLGEEVYKLEEQNRSKLSIDPALDPGLYIIIIESEKRIIYKNKLIITQ